MAIEKRNQLSEIMNLAWQMVKRNGYTMSEALKVAWTNIKLRALLQKKIVEFYFKKNRRHVTPSVRHSQRGANR